MWLIVFISLFFLFPGVHQRTEVCLPARPVRRSAVEAALRPVDQYYSVGGGRSGLLAFHPDAEQQQQQQRHQCTDSL